MNASTKLAVVAGASSGIERELAKCCTADGYDLILGEDEVEQLSTIEVMKSTVDMRRRPTRS